MVSITSADGDYWICEHDPQCPGRPTGLFMLLYISGNKINGTETYKIVVTGEIIENVLSFRNIGTPK